MMTVQRIELELAKYYGWGKFGNNIIVPNIFWGLNLNHECDLLIISKEGYATEIEIKRSKQDLIKDKEKQHGHRDKRIKYLYFAMPKKIYNEILLSDIPEHSGIFLIDEYFENDNIKKYYKVNEIKKPVKNQFTQRLTQDEIYHVSKLGVMRFWNLMKKCEV
jgi:hypothetical protein